MTVFLGLGSNRTYGNLSCRQLLDMAVEKIGSFSTVLSVSSIYRTAAMYVTDQEDFHNMVVQVEYEGSPESLLKKTQAVEASLGRDRSREIRFGPRSMDIDIEIFGDLKVSTPDLVIPHERICERAFVLKPLLEILNKDADKNKEAISFYQSKLQGLEDQRVEKED